MRTYGRTTDESGKQVWTVVETDANGFNDYVMLTTLCQCLLLNLGESPFYAQFGIPAKPSVVQQVFPDYYMAQTQRQFSSFFSSLLLTKLPNDTPTYRINVTLQQGVQLEGTVAK